MWNPSSSVLSSLAPAHASHLDRSLGSDSKQRSYLCLSRSHEHVYRQRSRLSPRATHNPQPVWGALPPKSSNLLLPRHALGPLGVNTARSQRCRSLLLLTLSYAGQWAGNTCIGINRQEHTHRIVHSHKTSVPPKRATRHKKYKNLTNG